MKQLSIPTTGNPDCPHGIWKIKELKETNEGVIWICPVCGLRHLTESTFYVKCGRCGAECCG